LARKRRLKIVNIFSDDTDLFQEVKHQTPLYNELLDNYLMDQQRKHLKAVLNDGEFSDEVWMTKKFGDLIFYALPFLTGRSDVPHVTERLHEMQQHRPLQF
jgi:hypothetical protein